MSTRGRFAWTPMALAVLVLGLAVTGCASTRFVATWKEPGVGPVELAGQKVAVFVISPNEALRRSAESAMARQISARGAEGVAGYSLLSIDEVQDKEAAAAALEAGDFDALLVMHAVGSKDETTWVPGTTAYAGWPPYYSSWGGYWGYGWGMAYDPGYMRTDTIVTVETLVYNVPEGKPIWAGRSETTNPSDVEKVIQEMAKQMDEEMVKGGLLS